MTLLLDYAREHGVAMGSVHHGRHVGWTTNTDAADALRERGANLSYYTSTDPKFNGWEVSFAQGREVLDDAA